MLIQHGANIHTTSSDNNMTAFECLENQQYNPVGRMELELYAKRENNWLRRKSFLLFLHVYKTQPTFVKQLVTEKVLAVPELLRLITSFL